MIRQLILIFLAFSLNLELHSQPGITILNQTMPTCTTQGSIVFKVTGNIPPITVEMTNTTCLGTNTVSYTSNTQTLTINNIPSCDSNYVFSFYGQFNALIDTVVRKFSNNDTCLALYANNSPVYCQNACHATATVTGLNGTAPYNYTWMPIGATTPVVSSVCPGSYTIIGKDANGKSGIVNLIVLNPSNPCVGIEEYSLYERIVIHPNPVSNTLFIHSDQYFEKGTEIEITNTLGQTVLKLNYTNEIDVSTFPQGYYIIKMISPDKRQFRSKFLKE